MWATLNVTMAYVLSFKPYVLLPIIILIFSQIFRIPLNQAIKSSLTIGTGFMGIFVLFGYLIERLGPAIQALIAKTGLQFNVLDVGWPPLAAAAWAYDLAPLFVILIFGANIILLLLKLTKTLNIDIWNYWHFILVGALVYETTGRVILSIAATLTATVITLKLADWSAPLVKKFTGLPGISITTFTVVSYFPLGVIGDQLLSKIPLINKLNVNPETIRKKLGFFGEPMSIGFLIGILLGIGAGYEIKGTLQLAIEIAAVTHLIPLMSGILAKGLIPISQGIKTYTEEKFPNIAEKYIGLHYGVLLEKDSVIVTGILLMPVAVLLALILPGVKFIPLGELANMIALVAMFVVVTQGNIVRSLIISIPIITGNLYVASYFAQRFTDLAHRTNIELTGYKGIITSFLEGGNLLRFWLIKTFEGNWWAISFVPVIITILVYSRSLMAKSNKQLTKDVKI